jgi:hypothetical protein
MEANVHTVVEQQGVGLARLNEHNDILLAVGESKPGAGAGPAETLYRVSVGPMDEAKTGSFLSEMTSGPAPVVVTESSSMAYHELRVDVLGGETWIFRVDKSGCDIDTLAGHQRNGVHYVSALATGRYEFDSEVRGLNDALLQFMSRPLVVDDEGPEIESDSGDPQAFICAAGGYGSVHCSWNVGTIGPIGGASCSVQCHPRYYYACCGPGVPNCECVPYDNDSGGGGYPPPPPPIPDPCDVDPSNCGDDSPHGN